MSVDKLCAICWHEVELSPTYQAGKPDKLRHVAKSDDHEPVSWDLVWGTIVDPPSEPRVFTLCDFCTSDRPAWVYPCQSFDVVSTDIRSIGAWVACEDCRPLVDVGDWPRMLGRRRGVPAVARRHLVDVWRQFGAHRVGWPIALELVKL